MHTYLHYLHTCIPAYSILSSLTPAYYPQGNILHKPACTEYTQTHLHMHAATVARQRVKKNFWFWFWFRCVLYICSVGTGYPNARLMGTCMYVLVGKVGGTGNMGSTVNIWGNAKKERETRSKKRKSPHFAEEFLVGGRTGTGTGTGCC